MVGRQCILPTIREVSQSSFQQTKRGGETKGKRQNYREDARGGEIERRGIGANRREQACWYREKKRKRGGETIGILHARLIERRRDEGKGGNDDAVGERDGLTVACTCALPPYTMRSYGVFLRVRPPYDMCTRVHVYDRISSGETNSISGTIRVRLSVRPREWTFRLLREVN